MKSCLGLLLVLIAFTVVIGGGGLIWYLSGTAEISRVGSPTAHSAVPPKAIPVAPKAVPVRPQTPAPARR